MSDITVTNVVTEVTVTDSGVNLTVAPGNAVGVEIGVSGDGVGIPPGGLNGQVLAKQSNTDYDATWVNQTGGGGGVTSVNGDTGPAVTLGPSSLKNVSAASLIGRQSGSAGDSQEILPGNGLKLSGTTLSADFDFVAPSTAAITAGIGLVGGGEVKDNPTLSVDFVASGLSSATKAVRADDGRIVPWSNPNPTLASNLSGLPSGTVIPVGETAIQVLQRILYPYQPVSLSGLSVSGLASVYELGQSFITSGMATWSTSGPQDNWVPGSGIITFTNPTGFTSTVASGFDPWNNSANIASIPAITPPTTPRTANTISFSLSATQDQGAVTPSTISRAWYSRMYFGKSTNSNLTTPTFDIAGSGNGNLLQTTNAQGPTNYSAAVGAGAGFFYLFIHDSYTLNNDAPYFGLKYGGNALAQDPIVVVSLTNAYGVTANYKRYKSTNSLGDAITIVVNPTS